MGKPPFAAQPLSHSTGPAGSRGGLLPLGGGGRQRCLVMLTSLDLWLPFSGLPCFPLLFAHSCPGRFPGSCSISLPASPLQRAAALVKALPPRAANDLAHWRSPTRAPSYSIGSLLQAGPTRQCGRLPAAGPFVRKGLMLLQACQPSRKGKAAARRGEELQGQGGLALRVPLSPVDPGEKLKTHTREQLGLRFCSQLCAGFCPAGSQQKRACQ